MARKGTAEMLKAKEAKQKKIAIVGFVIFLAVAAFQVPRTMKLLNGSGDAAAVPPPAATTTAAPAEGGLALPPVTATGAPAPTDPGSGTPSTDGGPTPAAGQLVSFTRFASKDPFVQQIDPGATDPAAGGSGGGGSPSAEGEDKGTGSSGSSGGGAKPTAPTTATLSVNGVREAVAVGGEFPRSAPTFRLAKLGASSAEIGIAGGSYASGEQTATLRKGKTLVLQNTADGTRYEIALVSVG